MQKISIARALLRKPYFLILDEPNNHLDNEAVQWLYNFIKDYKGTLIYIAHSENFIDLADNIVKVWFIDLKREKEWGFVLNVPIIYNNMQTWDGGVDRSASA